MKVGTDALARTTLHRYEILLHHRLLRSAAVLSCECAYRRMVCERLIDSSQGFSFMLHANCLVPGHLHLPWLGTHASTYSRFIRVLKSRTPFRFRRPAPLEFPCFGSQTISSGRRQSPNHHGFRCGSKSGRLKFGHGKSTLAVT